MGKQRKVDSESSLGSGTTTIPRKKSRDKKYDQSGRIPVEDTLQIKNKGKDSSSSGLVVTVENSRPVELKPDKPKFLDLSLMLEDAWSLMDMDMSQKRFPEQLCAMVPSLSKQYVKKAWRSLMDDYELDDAYNPGEMACQQRICKPFARLLMAAAGENGGSANTSYWAEEVVYSSLSIDLKAGNVSTIQKRKLAIRHNSAATLYQQWDAFAMMEIHAPDQCTKENYLIDYQKCVLMTSSTAAAVKMCIKQKDYGQVLLPFIIATGAQASLYVTRLDEQSNPGVFIVRYPDGSTSRNHDLSCYSSCNGKAKLYLAFAVLLNKFKNFFDAFVRNAYMEQVNDRMEALEDFEEYTPTVWSGSTDPESSDSNSSESDQPRRTNEEAAKEAAGCKGKFFYLVSPFESCFLLTDNSTEDDFEQINSPFYFRGCSTSSSDDNTTTIDVFLKVWRVDEVDVDAVTGEWHFHNRAYKAGIPVAKPALMELTRSTCSRGVEYLVFAMELVHQDRIASIDDCWHVSCSLIEAVLMLHQKAKILHCDIKPSNLRWNEQGVRLIDFEHAQDIAKSFCAPGTKGYQAPEISDGMPCSTKTDTFSVGQTISSVLRSFGRKELSSKEKRRYVKLKDVSMKLADHHPASRWSLSQALAALQNRKIRYTK